MNIPDVVELGYAVAVGTAVIGFLLWSARRQQAFMQQLVSNHLVHLTAAVNRLDKTLIELTLWLRRDGGGRPRG